MPEAPTEKMLDTELDHCDLSQIHSLFHNIGFLSFKYLSIIRLLGGCARENSLLHYVFLCPMLFKRCATALIAKAIAERIWRSHDRAGLFLIRVRDLRNTAHRLPRGGSVTATIRLRTARPTLIDEQEGVKTFFFPGTTGKRMLGNAFRKGILRDGVN
jgi:hypothetical protein